MTAPDDRSRRLPARLEGILAEAGGLGPTPSCDHRTGALLSTLAASKRGGFLVELGTGVGAGTAWLLDGMDPAARLVSLETESGLQEVARRHLGDDPRVRFVHGDADRWLRTYQGPRFDLAVVARRSGGLAGLNRLVRLLRPGALCVGVGPGPRPSSRPDGVCRLARELERQTRMHRASTDPSSGLVVAARLDDPPYVP